MTPEGIRLASGALADAGGHEDYRRRVQAEMMSWMEPQVVQLRAA